MKKRSEGGEICSPGRIMGMVFAFLCMLFGMVISDAQAPVEMTPENTLPPVQMVSDGGENIQAGCTITQTMGFSRCGHSVTRRVDAPQEIFGLDFAGVKNYYALWQIANFSREQMEMQREIDLFCPMHKVLTVNEAGEIILTQNQYGDGMAVLTTYEKTWKDFDEETGEALRRGLGFDSREDAERWLQSH